MDSRLDRALRYSDALPSGRWLYFVQCQDYLKIGVAADVALRIMTLQTGCPYELKLIGTIRCQNAIEDEAIWHEKLARYHLRGEWFKIPELEMREIVCMLSSPIQPSEPQIPETKPVRTGGVARLRRGWKAYGVAPNK